MKILDKKAFAIIEYVMVMVIVIGAFVVLRSYIQRGIFGMSAQAGQSFSYERQYDPQKSIECKFNEQSGNWYDPNCVASGSANCEASTCSNVCAPSSCSVACGAGIDNCGNPCTETSGCNANGPP